MNTNLSHVNNLLSLAQNLHLTVELKGWPAAVSAIALGTSACVICAINTYGNTSEANRDNVTDFTNKAA